MKVMHLLSTGGTGGIQTLIQQYSDYTYHVNIYVFAWGGGINADKMKQSGKNVILMDASTEGFLKTYRKLGAIVKNQSIEAIVVHISPLLRLMAFLICRQNKNIRLFYYSHSDVKNQYQNCKGIKKAVCRAIYKLCVRKSNAVIAISEYVKRTLMNDLQTPEKKIRVIYNGVDLKKFYSQIRLPENETNFFFAGRLIQEKGLQVALKSFKMIGTDCRWKFYIAGEGPYKMELEILAKKLKISDRVVFLGSRSDIPQLLSRMQIFIHPCILEEGFGIGIVEAMASGKLCICSKSGAIPEIIEDGKNGYLFETGNIGALAKLLRKVMDKTEDNSKMQENAQKRAADFSIERFACELDSVLVKN